MFNISGLYFVLLLAVSSGSTLAKAAEEIINESLNIILGANDESHGDLL